MYKFLSFFKNRKWLVFILIIFLFLYYVDYSIKKALDEGSSCFGCDFSVREKIGVIELQKWLDDGSLSFYDNQHHHNLVSSVQIYKINQNFIYTKNIQIGDFRSVDEGKTWYILRSKENGDDDYSYVKYETIEEMPTYAKINSENGDIEWFKGFAEMSEEDRIIFENL